MAPGSYLKVKLILKGVVYKFWKYFYYWSDLPEIYTQDVKLKKRFLVLVTFSDYTLVLYVNINDRTASVFMLE